MSHTTTIKSIAIKDANAIRQAVAELAAKGVNVRLEENARPRMYYSRQEEMCEFVLRLDNAKGGGKTFDVGLKLQSDGTYAVIMDEWAGGVRSQLGAACPVPTETERQGLHTIGQFAQQYARFAARNSAMAQGYVVTSDFIDADGNVQLEVSVG